MISKEQTDLVLRKNVENIIKKAAAGKILSKAEADLLSDSATPEETKAKNWTELAELLGITRKTVWQLKKENNGPQSLVVEEWQDFLRERSGESPHWQNEAHQDSGIRDLRVKLLKAQAGKEEATQKLKEYELKQVERNLVPMSEAKNAIKSVLGPLRSGMDNLAKTVSLLANPADPKMAEDAISEGMEGIFEMLEKAGKASKSGDE